MQGQAKHGGNQNSMAAWDSILPNLQKKERAFMSVILSRPQGATAKEVAEALRVPFHTVSGRPRKLVRDGFLAPTGEKRENCGVWIAVKNPQQMSLLEVA